jgi:hypothetical protein
MNGRLRIKLEFYKDNLVRWWENGFTFKKTFIPSYMLGHNQLAHFYYPIWRQYRRFFA